MLGSNLKKEKSLIAQVGNLSHHSGSAQGGYRVGALRKRPTLAHPIVAPQLFANLGWSDKKISRASRVKILSDASHSKFCRRPCSAISICTLVRKGPSYTAKI